MEVRATVHRPLCVRLIRYPARPKEHHAFDVLHWVKAAFKKHALDGFQESDCFNKEAFRCVSPDHPALHILTHAWISSL